MQRDRRLIARIEPVHEAVRAKEQATRGFDREHKQGPVGERSVEGEARLINVSHNICRQIDVDDAAGAAVPIRLEDIRFGENANLVGRQHRSSRHAIGRKKADGQPADVLQTRDQGGDVADRTLDIVDKARMTQVEMCSAMRGVHFEIDRSHHGAGAHRPTLAREQVRNDQRLKAPRHNHGSRLICSPRPDASDHTAGRMASLVLGIEVSEVMHCDRQRTRLGYLAES